MHSDPFSHDPSPERLLTPSEVAALFRVDPKTVARWAKQGKITEFRTLGGHRRYRASEISALTTRYVVPRQNDRGDGHGTTHGDRA